MFRRLLFILSIFFSTQCFAGDHELLWQALEKNNRQEARAILQRMKQNPATTLEASLTESFIQSFDGRERKLDGLIEQLQQLGPEKNAYLYALWFKEAMLGEYGKKTKPHQLDLISKIIADNSYNGSLQAAAHYVRALHYTFSNQMDKAKADYDAMGAIQQWQLVGPFENISGVGFHSEYGPETKPLANEKFKGANNIEVGWFTPTTFNNEGWVFTNAHIQNNTAVIYAQTFVYASEETTGLINVGCNGSVKLWVNDGLVLADSKARATELDYYKQKCTLHKGYNRVLLQLGFINRNSSNFIVRVTDDQFRPLKQITANSLPQPYQKTANATVTNSLPHFAETYFEKQIAEHPADLLNYFLLSQVYLRDEKTTEARHLIEKVVKKSPENSLVRFELIQTLLKSGNRTLMLQEIERLKEKDPESFLALQVGVNQLVEEEKYTEAAEKLKTLTRLYGQDANTASLEVSILGKLEKVEEFLKKIENYYTQYPENVDFVNMMFRVKKNVNKDPKGALAVYEKYLKYNYNFNIYTNLTSEYQELGLNDKYLSSLKSLAAIAPYDPRFSITLSSYYFQKQNYAKALEYVQDAIKLAPYEGSYWKQVGSIQEQMHHKPEATDSYRKSLYYDRTNYDARKKLTELEEKADLYKALPQPDVYDIIRKAPATSKEYNYMYLVDEKNAIIYEEGASEEYTTMVIKVFNQKGIESWKEMTLGYNSTQSLMVEKCEVVKANGNKTTAERNDDQVVFTGLEPGDAIYVKYRLQNYSQGRLGSQFWDKYIFNSFVGSNAARYTLIAPASMKLNTKITNTVLEPIVSDLNGFKKYTWELVNPTVLKDEPLMPSINDVGISLHVSTIQSWADVANWYSDIAYQEVADDYELNMLYNEIFEGQQKLSEVEKARLIYNYIVTNIQYSSVSFRQSGLVPQQIAAIINTKLGDCKDLSSLFVALAQKAGIDAQLVLVNTRNNGTQDVLLPSIEFNHCIVHSVLDGKEYYLELTDSQLPFGTLPNNLYKATSLIIPRQGQNVKTAELLPLLSKSPTQDKLSKEVVVSVNGRDLQYDVIAKRQGNLTSEWRSTYRSLTEDEVKKTFEQSVSNGYKNPVRLSKIQFSGLDNLADSVQASYSYTIKNEVAEAGSMKMIHIPLVDVIASLENFSADTREYPVEYWKYENTDVYESNATVHLMPGQTFIEIPADKTFSFKNSIYKIKFSKVGNDLKVSRWASIDRENVSPSDYKALKKFMNDIVEVEAKYLVFK